MANFYSSIDFSSSSLLFYYFDLSPEDIFIFCLILAKGQQCRALLNMATLISNSYTEDERRNSKSLGIRKIKTVRYKFTIDNIGYLQAKVLFQLSICLGFLPRKVFSVKKKLNN